MTLAPTPPAERDASIDVLRGAALFGVLLENLQHFASPTYLELVASGSASAIDRIVLGALRLFCDNKVYLLFAFLFGYGIALQMQRSARQGASFATLHLWRMGCLFLIGLANSLVWSGDILTSYAVLGCLLLALRHRSDAALLRVAGALLLAPGLAVAGIAAGAHALPGARAGAEAIATGLVYPFRQGCFSFAAFAVGLAAGRHGWLSSEASCERAARALPLALGVGLVGNLAFAMLEARGPAPLSWEAVAREATLAVAAPALAFAVALLVLRFARAHAGEGLRGPLAAVGRTTLSNYLLQSALGVGVVAQLGPVHPPAGLLLTLLLFGLELAASARWLAHFRFGPVEWLWRSLAYGRLEPLRHALR